MADQKFIDIPPLVIQKTTDIYAMSDNGLGSYYETRPQMLAYMQDNLNFLNSLLPDGQLFIGDAGNNASPVTMSGDATLNNAGALTLADVNVTPGSFGTANAVASIDLIEKGLITMGKDVPILIAQSQVIDLGADLNGKVNKSGDTMTGDLFLNADATAPLQATTLQQLQSAVLGIYRLQGNYNPNITNLFPVAADTTNPISASVKAGMLWVASAAGTANGEPLDAGDTLIALIDSPGQAASNWSIVQNNIGYTPLSNVVPASQLIVGNPSNIGTAVAITGAVAFDSAGNTTLSGLVTAGSAGSSSSTPVISWGVDGRLTATGAATITPSAIGAPQTDGTGATGTWGIDISGNAATVTNGVYTVGNQVIAGNKNFTGTTTVIAPVNNSDAATKLYVDSQAGDIETITGTVNQVIVDDSDPKNVILSLPQDIADTTRPVFAGANFEAVNSGDALDLISLHQFISSNQDILSKQSTFSLDSLSIFTQFHSTVVSAWVATSGSASSRVDEFAYAAGANRLIRRFDGDSTSQGIGGLYTINCGTSFTGHNVGEIANLQVSLGGSFGSTNEATDPFTGALVIGDVTNSVGIGRGNVNASGTITAGGILTAESDLVLTSRTAKRLLVVETGSTVLTSDNVAGVDPNTIMVNSLQPCFTAHLSTTQVDVIGGLAGQFLIAFDSVARNSGSHYNPANGIFTAPVTGLYKFSYTIMLGGGIANNNNQIQAYISSGGQSVSCGEADGENRAGSGRVVFCGSVTLQIAAGVTAGIFALATGGGQTIDVLGALSNVQASSFACALIA